MLGQLLTDAIKTGAVTVFGCAVTKAIGQKEISSIISGVGITLVGVDLLGILAPFCNGVMKVSNTVGKALNTVNDWGLVLEKILHLGN